MIIKYVAVAFGAVFEVYIMDMFMGIFSEKRKTAKKARVIFLAAVTCIYTTALFFVPGSLLSLCALPVAFAVSQLYNSKQYLKLVLAGCVAVISAMVQLFVDGILMLLISNTFLQLSSNAPAYALGILMSKFFMLVFTILIKFGAKKLSIENIGIKYLALLSILPLATVFVMFLMCQIIFIIDSSSLKITFILASMLLILANVVTLEVIRNQNTLSKAEYELKLFKENIAEQKKHYENAQLSHYEIQRIRHDMKNSYIAAIAEIQAGNCAAAVEQLKSNVDIIERSCEITDTGHPALDAIIDSKTNLCRELGIHIDMSYMYSSPICINEIEIAVVIGNILDNAIEACRKINYYGGEICGVISADMQEIIIDIKNTAFSSSYPETSKADRQRHGFGLKSVSHIAKKYNGYAKFSFNNNVFSSFVILKNKLFSY
ncbi:MAG: GHKL domain-containing protein [Clostridiales bacterium]|nr:GHKL domain-containing protein [Clostridiales bacterium]